MVILVRAQLALSPPMGFCQFPPHPMDGIFPNDTLLKWTLSKMDVFQNTVLHILSTLDKTYRHVENTAINIFDSSLKQNKPRDLENLIFALTYFFPYLIPINDFHFLQWF